MLTIEVGPRALGVEKINARTVFNPPFFKPPHEGLGKLTYDTTLRYEIATTVKDGERTGEVGAQTR